MRIQIVINMGSTQKKNYYIGILINNMGNLWKAYEKVGTKKL